MINNIITYVFAGLFAVMALWGYLARARRAAMWFGAVGAACAALGAYFDAVWVIVGMGAIALWGFIMGLRVIDLSWRARTGMLAGIGVTCFVALWPTLDAASDGRLPCPQWVRSRVAPRLVAGLDLRGGLRLVYTVDVDEAIRDKRDRYYEDMRAELARVYGLQEGDDRPTEKTLEKLREFAVVEASKTDTEALRVIVQPDKDASKVDTRFLTLFARELSYSRSEDQRTLNFRMRDEVKSYIRERAVSQAREIVLRRVDELGLKEAAVSTRDEDIIVEVPGEDEKSFERIREIISQTARLEFKLLDDATDFFAPLAERVIAGNAADMPAGIEFPQENAPQGVDKEGDTQSKTIYYAYLPKAKDETIQKTLDRFKTWAETLSLPPDREVGFSLVHDRDPDTLKETEAGWRTFLLKSRADITGEMIRDAVAMPDQDGGSLGGWHVALTFTEQGGTIFGDVTSANVKKRFAIILDDKVESAPVIQTAIMGGHASITMGSGDPQVQLEDSRKLELVLRSGALPAPISPSNEQRIGPSLGRDSIKRGVQGALGGSLIVMFFMLAYYRLGGLIANIAVTANLFLQLAILASFGASMTLPGIFGLCLTIGMSVDANVLINERIRDELRAGKSARASVELGFDRAVSAIVDGQLTTAIAAIILMHYGIGPIRGFAVTLLVGVICNVFTGVVVSRVLFDLWVRRSTLKSFTTNMG